MIHRINKRKGETMGELTARIRAELISEGKLPEGEPLSFAGRLDPAASGLCLFISGVDEIKKWRPIINAAPKTYKVQFLVGVKTDTGDLFGKVVGVDAGITEAIDLEGMRQKLLALKTQLVPTYSSRNVKKLLKGESVGEREQDIEIFNVKVEKVNEISINDVHKEVEELLGKIKGDFRYSVIRQSWDELQQKIQHSLKLLEFEITCSGGTYVRGLCDFIHKEACVFSLVRIRLELSGEILSID